MAIAIVPLQSCLLALSLSLSHSLLLSLQYQYHVDWNDESGTPTMHCGLQAPWYAACKHPGTYLAQDIKDLCEVGQDFYTRHFGHVVQGFACRPTDFAVMGRVEATPPPQKETPKKKTPQKNNKQIIPANVSGVRPGKDASTTTPM